METEPTGLSPKERLEQSRRAIAQQLARRRGSSIRTDEGVFVPAAADTQTGLLASTRRALRAWWQAHPIHNAVELGAPLLDDYARSRPYQLLGIAAGTGAALALLRTTRVLSLTGVALALLKTSDMKTMARQFMGWRSETPAMTAASTRTRPRAS